LAMTQTLKDTWLGLFSTGLPPPHIIGPRRDCHTESSGFLMA
jgi:hypothetical protein